MTHSTASPGNTTPGVLRPIGPDDHTSVLDLNARYVDLLSPLDEESLQRLLEVADLAAVIVGDDGGFAGFVVTMVAGSAYWSENFAWFSRHYDDFAYLDRVVLEPSYRRQGLATRAYDEVEGRATPHRRLLLEVVAEPPNEASLAFHRGRGYEEVGRQVGSGHLNVMMKKDLGGE